MIVKTSEFQDMKRKSREEAERAAERAKAEALAKIAAQRAADLRNQQLQSACVEAYKTSMRSFLSHTQRFYNSTELQHAHEDAKRKELSRV